MAGTGTNSDPNTTAANAEAGAGLQPAARSGRRSRKGAPSSEAPTSLNEIRYPCLMNMDYHAAREAWLDQAHRWLMFAVIVTGAAALFDIWDGMRLWGPAAAVVAGTLDLTFDLSNRARSHAMFRRRYAEILAEATRNPDRLSVLQSKLDELYGEEEPPFAALLALSAVKAQQATYGDVTDACRPGWLYRAFANVIRFSGHDFNEAKDAVLLPAASSPPNC